MKTSLQCPIVPRFIGLWGETEQRGGWGGVGERKESEERQRGEMGGLKADMGRMEEKIMQNMRLMDSGFSHLNYGITGGPILCL